MFIWNGSLFDVAGDGGGGGGAGIADATTSGGISTGFDIGNVDGELGDGSEFAESGETTGTEPLVDTTEEAEPIEDLPAEVSDEFDQDIGAPQIVDGPDGEKLYQYSAQQSQALQAQARFASELQTAIPDITVNDAIAHNVAYTDLSKIVHDIRRGTPEAATRFSQMILTEGGRGPFAGNLATALVNHLRTAQSPAYDQVKGIAEQELEKELYGLAAKAKMNPDKNIREGYTQLAKLLHYHLHNGEVREVEEYTAVDPLAERAKAVEARELALQQQEQQRVEAQQKAWVGAAKTTTARGLETAVKEALAAPTLKDRYSKDPELLSMTTTHVLKQVREHLAQDREWNARFDIQWDNAHDLGTRESLIEVTNSWLARAKSILKNQLPKMISSASNDRIRQSQSRHQQLQRASSASHRVPGASGVPTKQSIVRSANGFKRPDDYAKELDQL